jgi:hypothetical protein
MLFAIRLFLFHLSTLHVVFISRPTLHFLFFFSHSIAYEFHIQTRSYTAFIDDSVIFSWSCHLYLISRRPNILSRKGNCYESKRDDFPKTIFFYVQALKHFPNSFFWNPWQLLSNCRVHHLYKTEEKHPSSSCLF